MSAVAPALMTERLPGQPPRAGAPSDLAGGFAALLASSVDMASAAPLMTGRHKLSAPTSDSGPALQTVAPGQPVETPDLPMDMSDAPAEMPGRPVDINAAGAPVDKPVVMAMSTPARGDRPSDAPAMPAPQIMPAASQATTRPAGATASTPVDGAEVASAVAATAVATPVTAAPIDVSPLSVNAAPVNVPSVNAPSVIPLSVGPFSVTSGIAAPIITAPAIAAPVVIATLGTAQPKVSAVDGSVVDARAGHDAQPGPRAASLSGDDGARPSMPRPPAGAADGQMTDAPAGRSNDRLTERHDIASAAPRGADGVTGQAATEQPEAAQADTVLAEPVRFTMSADITANGGADGADDAPIPGLDTDMAAHAAVGASVVIDTAKTAIDSSLPEARQPAEDPVPDATVVNAATAAPVVPPAMAGLTETAIAWTNIAWTGIARSVDTAARTVQDLGDRTGRMVGRLVAGGTPAFEATTMLSDGDLAVAPDTEAAMTATGTDAFRTAAPAANRAPSPMGIDKGMAPDSASMPESVLIPESALMPERVVMPEGAVTSETAVAPSTGPGSDIGALSGSVASRETRAGAEPETAAETTMPVTTPDMQIAASLLAPRPQAAAAITVPAGRRAGVEPASIAGDGMTSDSARPTVGTSSADDGGTEPRSTDDQRQGAAHAGPAPARAGADGRGADSLAPGGAPTDRPTASSPAGPAGRAAPGVPAAGGIPTVAPAGAPAADRGASLMAGGAAAATAPVLGKDGVPRQSNVHARSQGPSGAPSAAPAQAPAGVTMVATGMASNADIPAPASRPVPADAPRPTANAGQIISDRPISNAGPVAVDGPVNLTGRFQMTGGFDTADPAENAGPVEKPGPADNGGRMETTGRINAPTETVRPMSAGLAALSAMTGFDDSMTADTAALSGNAGPAVDNRVVTDGDAAAGRRGDRSTTTATMPASDGSASAGSANDGTGTAFASPFASTSSSTTSVSAINSATSNPAAGLPQTASQPAGTAAILQQSLSGQPRPAAQVTAHMDAARTRMASAGGETHFVMTLMPAELGRVRVEMKIDAQGRLSARFSAENAGAIEALTADQAELERSLSKAGFKVETGALRYDVDRSLTQGFNQAQGTSQGSSAQAAGGQPGFGQDTGQNQQQQAFAGLAGDGNRRGNDNGQARRGRDMTNDRDLTGQIDARIDSAAADQRLGDSRRVDMRI